MSSSVYIVFGATGGIGKECVVQLANAGHTVIAVGRKEANDFAAITGGQVHYKQLSEFNFASIDSLFSEIKTTFQHIDGVVNCIGSILLKPAHLTTEQEWHDVIMVNLETAFAIVRAAGKTMTDGGAVVLMSSAATKIGLPSHEAIAAAKGGINGLVLSAAATYATRNLRFNAVAPGLVETPLTQRITQNPAALAASLANHPLGRIGKPEEVARLIVWLLAPENSWITGQIISLDGGLASVRGRVSASTN